MRHDDQGFSIGAKCACSQTLRNAILRFSSIPFDWVACSIFARQLCFLTKDFRGWLDHLVAKYSYKLYMHLHKQLAIEGIV